MEGLDTGKRYTGDNRRYLKTSVMTPGECDHVWNKFSFNCNRRLTLNETTADETMNIVDQLPTGSSSNVASETSDTGRYPGLEMRVSLYEGVSLDVLNCAINQP